MTGELEVTARTPTGGDRIQSCGKVAWDAAPWAPITDKDVAVSALEAEAELAVGFFGSRSERAMPADGTIQPFAVSFTVPHFGRYLRDQPA